MTAFPSVVVAVAVLSGIASFIMVQQRHDTKLVNQLRALVGQPMKLGINVGRSQFSAAVFNAALDTVESRSRWVTFQWLTAGDDPTSGRGRSGGSDRVDRA